MVAACVNVRMMSTSRVRDSENHLRNVKGVGVETKLTRKPVIKSGENEGANVEFRVSICRE